MNDFTVVVPTIGRPSLTRLLGSLRGVDKVVVVDDRPRQDRPLVVSERIRLIPTAGGRGPAAARNLGWRAADSEWVVFLDDDVVTTRSWLDDLQADLAACGPAVAGTKGRVEVPLPHRRAPTDRERKVAGLAGARWITADMAYRRDALRRLGGFDERFRRAYREDSDLALRMRYAGWDLIEGRRRIVHPVVPAPWWASVQDQKGNRDDVLMRRLHGAGWRAEAGAGRGRAGQHLVTTAALVLTPLLALSGRKKVAGLTAAAWVASTTSFAWSRIRPGPRTLSEMAAMVTTSAAIPSVATISRTVGLLFDRDRARRPGPAEQLEAVLFDRDGTLMVDIPYNGDPAAVTLVPGADRAVSRLRAAGLRVGLVSNQSGVGRGLIAPGQVDAVNHRLESLIGRFDTIVYCPHSPEDQCRCRKPAPGLIFEAARRMGVDPERCVVVGDILSDILAAEAAGARAVLVPNQATAPREIGAALHVAHDIPEAAELVLSWRRK